MTKLRIYLPTLLAVLAFGGIQAASAATVTSSLGNINPGFNSGDIVGVPAVGTAQQGQPVPFDQGYGTDGLFGGNFMQSWTHSFALPALETIVSASITIGLFDHDSSASGAQVGLFSVDGIDQTAGMLGLVEAAAGEDLMYNEFTLSLGASTFAGLATGSADITLNMLGPGLVTPLFPLPGPNPPVETSTNGANLLFSTLTINTAAPPAIPIPAAAPLFASALVLMGLYRRRIQRKEV